MGASNKPRDFLRAIADFAKNFSRRQLGIGAAVLAALLLLIGWGINSYLEDRRLIKSPDEPAAALLRDDAAKAKDPRLFVRLKYGSRNLEKDGTTLSVHELRLEPDEKACRDYYGQDGLTQCKNNWGFLNPEAQGWNIDPPLPGEWAFRREVYREEAAFTFNPAELRAGQQYEFMVPRKLGENVRLASYKANFKTLPMELAVRSWRFVFDPQNPRLCMISGQISSNYPLDRQSFTELLNLKPAGGTLLGEPELVFSENNRKVAVNVKILRLPEENAPVTLRLEKGVRREGSQDRSAQTVSSGADVPGASDFVRLNDLTNFVHTDDELASRQTLALEFNLPVNVRETQQGVKALLLPTFGTDDDKKQNRPTRWTDYSLESGPVREILKRELKPLELTPVYTPEEYSTLVSFTYSAPPGYYFLLHGEGGASSVTDYKLSAYRRILRVTEVRPEARIMQKGNILSLGGSKKLAVLSRGVDEVRGLAYRVRPEFISLLMSTTDADLTDPSFQTYGVSMLDMSETLNLSYKPQKTSGHEPDYHALDLAPLLEDGGKGVFRLELRGLKDQKQMAHDQRFLLLTDLGLNVKQGPTGERELFVSSFAHGGPLDGVTVEVLGRNGLPVFSGRTTNGGLVKIPALDGLSRERQPVVIVARHDLDFTFMGLKDGAREVPTGRFPESHGRQVEAGGISAFVFSERGIFKPGEELRFGALLKSTDWQSAAFKGLPARAVLTNPRGIKVYEKQHALNESGLIDITVPTQETDPTGRYNLDIYLDKRHLGSAQAQVEEFQPDNLKVDVSLKDVSAARLRKGWLLPQDLRAVVGVENLYGTAAVDNRVTARLALAPARLAFSQYADYTFFDPGADTRSQTQNLGENLTNAQGEAEFALNLDRFDSGTYRLTFDTEAFESGGGRGVSARLQALVSPLSAIVGWRSEAKLHFIAVNSKTEVSFIAVDSALERAGLERLEMLVSEVEYVASLVRNNSGEYRYDKVRRLKPLHKRQVDVGTEGLTLSLPTERTGEFELSLTDGQNRQRCNLSYVVAGGSQRRFGLERDATLRVHLDKQEYRAGENMRIFISAPYAGSGLITLESDRVLSHHWFTASTSDSVQEIRAPENFEGRGFVSVSLARDIHSDAVHSTPYSFALAPFICNIERRDLKLKLEGPELIQPGETLRMRLTADKPGRAVVFAVSEGILQLTSYRTPSPLTYFLKQNPLSVSTMQNWDLLMPEFNLMNPAIFGGGYEMANMAAAKQLNPFRRKSEPSVVYWSGLVEVGPEGKELTWETPAYFNGSLRLMAVAAGEDAVGESSRNTTVRGPLIITPDLPVAVAPGDEFEVTAAIANNIEDSGQRLAVSVKVELDQGLEFVRKPPEEIRVDEGREGKAVFRLKATKELGEAVVRISAQSSFQGREINVRRPVSLSVRPASPRMSSFKAGLIKGREQTVPTGRELFPQYAQVEASLSGLPLPIMDGLSGFLTRFPYGCTEQILSAAFPYVLLNRSPELLPMPKEMDPARFRLHMEKAVEKGLITLQERQVYPGRFSLWPYDSYCYPFLTVYSLDYLLSAREAGYRIPEDLFRDTQNATRALLQSAPQSLEGLRTISYAAWVYVRSGQRFTGLPQLIRDLDNNLNKKWRSEPSAALLAACFKMMQQDKEADELLKNVRALDGKSYTNSWFYCRLWENSLFLTALARHFPEQLTSYEGNKALVQIINDVGSGDYSSPCAAQAVRGIADYAASNLGRKENLLLQALDAQGKTLPGEGTGEALKRLSLGHEAASFRFSGAEGLYWQISADGFDLKPAPPKAAKISLATRYIPAAGKKLEDLGQGDEVYVLISAAATAATDNVAITSLLPGGFEMVISKAGQIVGGGASDRARPPDREDDDEDGEYEINDEDDGDYGDSDDRDSSWNLDETASYPNRTHMREALAMLEEAGIQGQPMNLVHVERREDRMVAYASLGKDERLFIYRIKAINKGKFTLPSAFAEALYDPEARANTGPGSLEVR